MVKITYSELFEKELEKIKDQPTKEKIKKQIRKIIKNPEVGKPLKYEFKGERALYVRPYRLIYALGKEEITLLRFQHREEAYR